VINVDQSPIGRTPRSNPATYTGLFTPIRELFAGCRRRASAATGRALLVQRQGRTLRILPGRRYDQGGDALPADVYVPCDVCHSQRYNRETLEILYKGKNVTRFCR